MKKDTIKCFVGLLILLFLIEFSGAQPPLSQWKHTMAFPYEEGKDSVMVQVGYAKDGSIQLVYKLPIAKTKKLGKKFGNNNMSQIILGSAPATANEGEPVLPVIPVKVVIPKGFIIEKHKIKVSRGGKTQVPGIHYVIYGEATYPLIPGVKPRKAEPKQHIYNSDSTFPGESFNLVTVQRKHGVKVAFINLYPLTYRPKSGKLACYTTISLKIPIKRVSAGIDPKVQGHVEKFNFKQIGVDNPEDLKSYQIRSLTSLAPSGICNPLDNYQYVIVTNQAVRDATTDVTVNDLIAHKQSRGLTATIVTIEDIYANYSGVDNAEKLRNFIIDAYNNWGADYVLLGGDINILPFRYLNADGTNIPSDLYFQCLDGTFDGDGDGVWGEPNDGPGGGDVDLMAEVYIGRASAENADEMSNFVYKTLAYENESDDAPYLYTALMCGEHLGFGGPSEYAKPSMEEIRLGSSNHGYVTVGFDACPTMDVKTLYDADGVWPKIAIIDSINSNMFSIINHLGHANTGYVMKFYNSDADALTNTNFLFAYSQGCIPGDFTADCIGEHLTTSHRYGMYAVVFNSRYGWGKGNSTDGPSQRFDRQFWDAYFGEYIFNLGAINADSHEDNIWDINGGRIRWCYYETNLLGDPQTPLRGQITGPFIAYSSHTFSDATGGNNDGLINPGEQIDITATLVNVGSEDATDVNAVLSTSDSYITILDNTAAFGNIPCCGAKKQALDDFRVDISSNCPTPYTATLDLTITDNQSNSWSSGFTISIYTSSQISGYVTTITGSTPIEGATVEFFGPISGSVQTNASGYYMFGGIDATYAIIAKAENYLPSDTQKVDVPPNAENINFELGRPEISLTPAFLNVELNTGENLIRKLTVSNTGDLNLDYSIMDITHFLPKDFLVSYWPFSEGMGEIVFDMMGDNNGTIKGASWINSQERTALSFDGVDDYICIPHPIDGDMDFGTGDFSIGVWVNTTANTGILEGRDEILSKGDASVNGFALSIRNNKACFWVGSCYGYFGTTEINDGEWHLIVGVREAGTLRLYVDGNLEVSASNTNTVNTSSDLFIGKHGTKGLCYFDGIINSNYIYGRSLSEDEILDIYTYKSWLSLESSAGIVLPGASKDVNVNFDAVDLFADDYFGELNIIHNDPVNTVPLIIPCTLTVNGFRSLTVSPDNYDFGNLWAGLQSSGTITLSNTGNEATTVNSITSDNTEFTHNAVLPLIVPRFESVTFEVIFAPVDVGAESGVLTINSDAEDNPTLTVNLSGTGTAPPGIAVSPSSFSEVLDAGSSLTRTLTITNNGGDNLNYSIIQTDLLVSYWPFSEGVGDVLNDEVGNNNGDINGAVWVYEKGRSALSFDGIDDTVLVPHPVDGSMDFGTGDFSVGVWINTTANTGTSGNRDEILSKGDASNNGFALSIRNNKACFWIGSGYGYFGTTEINDGEWHLIVGVREAGTVRLYVDAILEISGSNSQTVNTASDFFIGMHGTKDLCYFEGLISSTFLYEKALTIEEIDDIYGIPSWLTIPVPSGTVLPSSSADVDIIFQAIGLIEGDYFNQLNITHNDPGEPVPLVVPCALTVNGFRSITVSPENYDFGNLWAGLQSSGTITLSNAGSEATTVNSITSDNGEFTHNAILPITLPPFESVTFKAIFAPVDVGVETGVLTINSDAGDNPVLTVNLTGNGIGPPQAHLDPTVLTYNLQPADAPADQTSVLSNNGGDVLSYQVYSVREISSPLQKLSNKRKNSIPPIRHNLIYHDKNYQNPFVPGRVIVGFKENENSFDNAAILSSIGVKSVRELAIAKSPTTHQKVYKRRKLLLITLLNNNIDDVLAAIQELRNDPNIAYAEPDYIVKTSATPDDPHYSLLYGMHNTGQTGGTLDADIDAPEAWDRHTGNRKILIGVIDTGIDYNHPDLAVNIWTNPGEIPANGIDDDGNGFIDDVYGWDFAYDDSDPMDGHSHGTHCAGTIAGVGNNGVGVVGVMWDADVVAIKFLNDGGSGSTSDAIDAVNYATAMGIHITSNSWGGGGFSQALMDAIEAGGLFVASAGNYSANNDVTPHYPSSYNLDNIIAVAATDHNDALASFSNYGPTSVDLGAPGVDIYSCQPGSGYQYKSGTSMASPHVSGCVGLVWSYNPMLTALEVKQIVLDNVDPVSSLDGMVLTGGRMNVDKAICATGPSWLSVVPLDPGTLNPGDNQIYTVTVDPAGLVAGQWRGEILIETNDPLNPEVSIEIIANIAGSKSLVVSPNSLDFGSVWVGLDNSLQLTLFNDGNEATTVNSITSDNAEFTHNAVLPLTVPPFQSVTFEAIFAPSDIGAESGVLAINSDAGDNPVLLVNLSGTGTAPSEIAVSPSSFSEVLYMGNSLTRILTIANNGGDDLNYSIISIGSNTPTDLLVSYWPFSEGAGDVLNDEIGNNNGEINGAVWVYEKGRPALSFDGIDDTVLVHHPVDGSMDFGTGDFSVAVWINTITNTGTGVSRDEIVSKGDASINGFTLSARNNKACFWVGASGEFFGTSDINDGEWHMIVGVREAGTVRLYVDATLETSGSNSQTVNTATDFFIGMHGTKDICYFDGLISKTYLYKKALTQEEIGDIYGSPSWITIPDPSGTVQPGLFTDVNIVFESAGLAEGNYSGQLDILHNAPGTPVPLAVPCALTVTSQIPSSSRILFIGQSASIAAYGNRYIMEQIIIGSPTSGTAKGSKYQIELK